MAHYKLWTNARNHHAATAFISAIKIQNRRWSWTENNAEADLWCICTDEISIESSVVDYASLVNKPAVAYLATEFSSMPYDAWVYFRVPLNVGVLHNWLTSKQLGVEVLKKPELTDARWRNHAFKLNYWPNVSSYVSGGSEIMMVCSRLLHGWCYYDELLSFNVDQGTLDVMLIDAVEEGNLIYGESTEDSVPVVIDAEPVESQGLFKRIFSRFSRAK